MLDGLRASGSGLPSSMSSQEISVTIAIAQFLFMRGWRWGVWFYAWRLWAMRPSHFYLPAASFLPVTLPTCPCQRAEHPFGVFGIYRASSGRCVSFHQPLRDSTIRGCRHVVLYMLQLYVTVFQEQWMDFYKGLIVLFLLRFIMSQEDIIYSH